MMWWAPERGKALTANKKKKVGQTSPGTLYFFITIPTWQSITQTDSPPQVATRRLPPAGKKKINTIPSERIPLDVLLVWGRTGGAVQRLEGAGPQLGGEVLGAVLLAVALQDVERLQVNRLQEEADQTCLNSGGPSRTASQHCDLLKKLPLACCCQVQSLNRSRDSTGWFAVPLFCWRFCRRAAASRHRHLPPVSPWPRPLSAYWQRSFSWEIPAWPAPREAGQSSGGCSWPDLSQPGSEVGDLFCGDCHWPGDPSEVSCEALG